MNILVITKRRETFFAIKKFLEENDNQVQDIEISTQYTKENLLSLISKKINELNSIKKIDLVFIDLFLKIEECNLPEDSDFPSVLISINLQKEIPDIKVAFLTDSCKLTNHNFHQNYKGIDPKWTLIHNPKINKVTFTDREDRFMNCPYMFDKQLNKCHIIIHLIQCKRSDCFYNQILLAASIADT